VKKEAFMASRFKWVVKIDWMGCKNEKRRKEE
jgi:hypothetical protein